MKILEGKVSIVTGAGSGMGRAIAKIYAREGSFVVVADVKIKNDEETVKLIEDAGGKGCAVLVDVTKEEDIKKMFDCAIEKFGTLDILVNNAGIMDNFEPAEDMTDELWDKVFAVNTTSVMRTTRRALPIFKKKGKGVIINITSAGGLYGSRAGAAYTASKHAVTGFTHNVGFQYALLGIRCNAIAPGAVKTNIGSTITNPDEFGSSRAMAGMSLNPRSGEPEEVAEVALFLASDKSSFVNGETVKVDGGWTAY